MLPFILQGSKIILYVNNAPVIIDTTHINYKIVKEAIIAGDWETVKEMATIKSALTKVSNGRVSVSEDEVLFDGVPVHNALTRRMIQRFSEGFPFAHFCKFMENLDANPSYRARNELYNFLEACNLPITDDGCFLAYKKIRADWTDCFTGKIDNSIGAKPTMNRRDVNEDPTQTCSAGLHVCSYSYLKSYSGDRIVAVKVNPADVVSCPVDYSFAKLRVCAYEVIDELPIDAAQENDVLSSGPAVKESRSVSVPAKKSYRVEDVLEYIGESDFLKLCNELSVDCMDFWSKQSGRYETEYLVDAVKIGFIRKAINKLGLA